MNGWLAQHVDPMTYGLAGWIVIAVAFSTLVGWAVAGVWSLWIQDRRKR